MSAVAMDRGLSEYPTLVARGCFHMQVYGRKLYVTLYDHPIHYHIPTKQKCLGPFFIDNLLEVAAS